MFQCRRDVIRPHQRVTVPKFELGQDNSQDKQPLNVSYDIGWKIWDGIPHNSNLDNWTRVKIEVRGSGAKIWIDDKLAYHSENIIPYPMGRVGFRNSRQEEAHFRKVRVHIIS